MAVLCECGNRRMTIHILGIRCQNCSLLHDHAHYELMRRRCIAQAQSYFYSVRQNSSLEFLKKMNLPVPPKMRRTMLLNAETKKLIDPRLWHRIRLKKRIA